MSLVFSGVKMLCPTTISNLRVRGEPEAVARLREQSMLRDVASDQQDSGLEAIVTIDRAIAEARAAVARDSASAFLNDQLHKALEKKLGLLRTVALLPPRA